MGGARIGGEAVQQTLLAREFVRSGYDVSMIVKDYGQPDGEVIDGIRVFKTYKESAGLPGVRFLHPRATSIIRALRRADAETYYQSCAGVQTGYVARHCRKKDRNFVFRVASDADCVPGEQLIGLWRDRKIYEYGLRRADLILAQSRRQMSLLKEHYGLESTLVNMAAEIPEGLEGSTRDIDALWVGNFRPLKRPEIVIELAARLPQRKFAMIGGPAHDPLYFDEIKERALSTGNIQFLGRVPYRDMSHYFSRTKVFINTSEVEGFPNTFLQSWMHGVPVVSFFDPDGIIANEALGQSPSDVDEMARIIEQLATDDVKRTDAARHVQSFALRHYSPETIVDELVRIFSEALSRN